MRLTRKTDHTQLLEMLAYRAECFPNYPIGGHIPEVFAALGRPIPIGDLLAQPPLPVQPAQEPVAWADLVKEAQQIVKSKFLWKKFIDKTPLANDIACWMADFAQQHTTPPLPTQPAQEPVAWIWKDMRGQDIVSLFEPRFNSIPLYTAPSQRQPLTDETEAVIAAAKAAMDASFETKNRELDISIPAHLAAALSLRLDEFEAAHNIGAKP